MMLLLTDMVSIQVHFNVLATLKLRFNKLLNKFGTSHSSEQHPFSNAFQQGKLLGINLGKTNSVTRSMTT